MENHMLKKHKNKYRKHTYRTACVALTQHLRHDLITGGSSSSMTIDGFFEEEKCLTFSYNPLQ